MKCKNCGQELMSNTRYCPKCGCPVSYQNPINYQQPIQNRTENYQQQINQSPKKGLSTGAIVVIVIGAVFFALCLLCTGCVACVACAGGSSSSSSDVVYSDTRIKEEKKWSDYYEKHKSEYIEVAVDILHDNIDNYKGKKILTAVKIDDKNAGSFNTSLSHSNSIFYACAFYFKEYDEILDEYKEGEMVVIIGDVDNSGFSWTDISVSNCHIITSGSAAKNKASELDAKSLEAPDATGATGASISSVWAQDYTSINDFKYIIDGNDIYIGRYKGQESKIRINSTYVIDGKDYTVVALNDATFFCDDIQSVIIPEGTKNLADNTFNSCGIKFLYLPSTLESVDDNFWDYFHDVEKIYYGGTEEQWKKICKVSRSDIDVHEIVYNSKLKDLK